jgi:hypothetical protein
MFLYNKEGGSQYVNMMVDIFITSSSVVAVIFQMVVCFGWALLLFAENLTKCPVEIFVTYYVHSLGGVSCLCLCLIVTIQIFSHEYAKREPEGMNQQMFDIIERNRYSFLQKSSKSSKKHLTKCDFFYQNVKKFIRTYAEEENFEAIFRRSGSEFIILRITNTENCTFFGQKKAVILPKNMVALETFFFQ